MPNAQTQAVARPHHETMPLVAASGLLVCALLLGGATRSGAVGDVIVQFLAIPLLLLALWQAMDRDSAGPRTTLVFVVACALIVPLVQLVPLPAWVHGDSLIDRLVREGRVVAGGRADGWYPISVSPQATWAAAISVLPALAMFSVCVGLSTQNRWRLLGVFLAFVAGSVVLGLMQIAQGPDSGLRLFEVTNTQEAVGFFANRNHFAALLYTGLCFATLALGHLLKTPANRRGNNGLRTLLLFACALLVVSTVTGLAMARSRAGLFLAIAGLCVCVPLILSLLVTSTTNTGRGEQRIVSVQTIVLAVVGFAIVFSALFGLDRVLTRFASDPSADLRLPFAQLTAAIAQQEITTGTGLGTFVPVYAASEPSSSVTMWFANRAHNDLLEFIMETGVMGLAILIIFLVWLVVRGVLIWRERRDEADASDDHILIATASLLVIVLLLVHSLVDYPLRTTAMAVVFAMACAFLIPAPMRTLRVHHDRHAHAPSRERPARPLDTQDQPGSVPVAVRPAGLSEVPGWGPAVQPMAAHSTKDGRWPTADEAEALPSEKPEKKSEPGHWGKDFKWPES